MTVVETNHAKALHINVYDRLCRKEMKRNVVSIFGYVNACLRPMKVV